MSEAIKTSLCDEEVISFNGESLVAASNMETIAQVLSRMAADPAISEKRFTNTRSGTKRILAAIGIQPELAPTRPRFYTERLASLSHIGLGISNGRFRNCLSSFQHVLMYAGKVRVSRRTSDAMGPAFLELYERVPDKATRIRLGRFFRYVTGKGANPDDVSTQMFDRFLGDIEASGAPKARAVDRMARLAWNKAASSVYGWPNTQVEVPSYVSHYVHPIEAFQPEFRADIDAYITRRSKNPTANPLDDLDEEGLFESTHRIARTARGRSGTRRAGPVRESTANLIAYQLRQFASVLVHQNLIEINSIQSIRDIVDPALVKEGLMHFISRVDNLKNSQIFGIATKLAMAARFWVKLPEEACDQLDRFANKVRPKHEGLPESARRALAPLKSEENVRRFLNLPDRVFADLAKKKTPTAIDANVAAAALWIAIVQRIPLRISNLCSIDTAKHVLRAHAGKGAERSLYFTAKEVKNDKAIEAPLSPRLVRLLDTYCERYLPLLQNVASTALFPSQNGKPKRSNTMSVAIQRLMRRRLGFSFNPHSFRHVAAMFYLTVHPGDYVTVQLLLGHRKLETTIKYYCDLRTEEAFAQFDKAVLKLSKEEIHG